MFEILKSSYMGGLSGFALTFDDGRRVEVDFGPMSQSEGKNRTRKEFEHNMKSGNAEVKLFMPGETVPSFSQANCTVENLISVLNSAFVES